MSIRALVCFSFSHLIQIISNVLCTFVVVVVHTAKRLTLPPIWRCPRGGHSTHSSLGSNRRASHAYFSKQTNLSILLRTDLPLLNRWDPLRFGPPVYRSRLVACVQLLDLNWLLVLIRLVFLIHQIVLTDLLNGIPFGLNERGLVPLSCKDIIRQILLGRNACICNCNHMTLFWHGESLLRGWRMFVMGSSRFYRALLFNFKSHLFVIWYDFRLRLFLVYLKGLVGLLRELLASINQYVWRHTLPWLLWSIDTPRFDTSISWFQSIIKWSHYLLPVALLIWLVQEGKGCSVAHDSTHR